MYNKLFTKILDSTIWLESTSTRIVWVTFIAAMDEHGFVEMASPANVAARARVTLREAVEALRVLESDDANDPEQAHHGRRIERVPGGWVVLNAGKYRELVTRAAAQASTRDRVARFRERQRNKSTVTPPVTPPSGNGSVTQSEAVSEAVSDQVNATGGADAPGVDEGKSNKAKPQKRKTHKGHVLGFCDWLCFPRRMLDQFVNTCGEDVSTPELREEVEQKVIAWASQLREMWQGRAIGDSPWVFWGLRWKAAQGTTDPKDAWRYRGVRR